MHIPVFGMVFYFREQTSFIWSSFFLFSRWFTAEQEREEGCHSRCHSGPCCFNKLVYPKSTHLAVVFLDRSFLSTVRSCYSFVRSSSSLVPPSSLLPRGETRLNIGEWLLPLCTGITCSSVPKYLGDEKKTWVFLSLLIPFWRPLVRPRCTEAWRFKEQSFTAWHCSFFDKPVYQNPLNHYQYCQYNKILLGCSHESLHILLLYLFDQRSTPEKEFPFSTISILLYPIAQQTKAGLLSAVGFYVQHQSTSWHESSWIPWLKLCPDLFHCENLDAEAIPKIFCSTFGPSEVVHQMWSARYPSFLLTSFGLRRHIQASAVQAPFEFCELQPTPAKSSLYSMLNLKTRSLQWCRAPAGCRNHPWQLCPCL